MFKDMGLPWEPEVKNAVQAQRKVFESLGCIVVDAEPDFSGANEAFLAWRHWSVELAFGDLLATHGDQLNEYIHWHVEEGRKLTGPYLARSRPGAQNCSNVCAISKENTNSSSCP